MSIKYHQNGTGGIYTVKAVSESEAQEKALTEICDKLYRALLLKYFE